MRRGELTGSAAPVIGVDLDPLLADPGGLAGVSFRNLGRDARILRGVPDLEAMEVLSALSEMARLVLVTWGPANRIRRKFRHQFPGRILVFATKREVASHVVGQRRMLYYLTRDEELAAMIPVSSGTETVNPDDPSEDFKAAIRTGRRQHRGR